MKFQQQQQGVYTNYNQSDVTLNDKNADYNRVALQLVEEENEQRKKSVKYPNLENYQILDQMGEGAFPLFIKPNTCRLAKKLPSRFCASFKWTKLRNRPY